MAAMPRPRPFLDLSHTQLRTALAHGFPLPALTAGRHLVVTPTGGLHDPTCPHLRPSAGRRPLLAAGLHPPLRYCRCVTSGLHWARLFFDVTQFATIAGALAATGPVPARPRPAAQVLIAAEHLQPAVVATRPGVAATTAFTLRGSDHPDAPALAAAYDALRGQVAVARNHLVAELLTDPAYRPAQIFLRDPLGPFTAAPTARGPARRAALAATLGVTVAQGPDWTVVAAPWTDHTPWNPVSADKHAVALAGPDPLPDGIWTAFAAVRAAGPTHPATVFAAARGIACP